MRMTLQSFAVLQLVFLRYFDQNWSTPLVPAHALYKLSLRHLDQT